MNISRLKPASEYDVREWLEEHLQLSPYQKQKLYDDEFPRLSPFYFYKKKEKEKVFILWRFTIVLIPFYILILLIGLPINMVINGRWGYSQKFVDSFHGKWMNKLQLNF